MITKITYKKQGDNKDSWIKTFFDDSDTECIGAWVAPPEIVYEDPAKQNKDVELWRIKGVLTLMGRINEVDIAIEKLPEPNRTLAGFVWNSGNSLNSQSETVKFVQASLNLTDEEKDSIFEQAAAIKL